MAIRHTHVGLLSLLLTLGCSSTVEIGHGNGEGGEGGDDSSGTGASAGAVEPGGSSGSSGTTSTGGTAVGGGGPIGGTSGTTSTGGTSITGGPIPADDGPQALADKVDLLIAVDNSISMAEKQKLFAQTVPELVMRLVSPYCVLESGTVVSRPATPSEACPEDSQREFEPLRDLHVGVITTSLGSHGATGARNDVCAEAGSDDHAHLIALERDDVPSYDGRGYLKWDPEAAASPPGEDDVQGLADSLKTMIDSAGEHGCGYEAPLEAVYRFLVDPEPPLSVEVDSATRRTKKVGVDQSLLTQRADFLRPDSSVAVLVLTDENDCSVVDEGYGYLVNKGSSPMFRSTSACHDDPNDVCCQSCGEVTAHEGCGPISADPECVNGAYLDPPNDDLNLRCFDQKRRFGLDLLYPTSRYVSGFGGGQVPDRHGSLVENPLFHSGGHDRDPSLFTFTVLGGVPWQDIATSSSLTSQTLNYLTPEQLTTQDRWSLILGNPAADVPPSDPFMQESSEERSGVNPIINASIEPSSSTDPQANLINGHEQNTADRDLQYACTFELPEPVECDEAAGVAGIGCDCFAEEVVNNRPLCQPPGGGATGTTQYYAKAYPALRPLAVAKELGRRTVLGSVCARNTQDDAASDYGYRPLFGALGRRIAATLVKP